MATSERGESAVLGEAAPNVDSLHAKLATNEFNRVVLNDNH